MSTGLFPANSLLKVTRKATDVLFPAYASDWFPAMRNLGWHFSVQV